MNASRLLIATACSLAVAGAATVAFAQTTTPGTPNSTATNPVQNQGQNPGQMPGQTPSTTTRDGTMPGSMNPTTQRPYESTTPGADTTGTYGTTGTAATRANDGTMRYPTDRATMGTERSARADRN